MVCMAAERQARFCCYSRSPIKETYSNKCCREWCWMEEIQLITHWIIYLWFLGISTALMSPFTWVSYGRLCSLGWCKKQRPCPLILILIFCVTLHKSQNARSSISSLSQYGLLHPAYKSTKNICVHAFCTPIHLCFQQLCISPISACSHWGVLRLK